MVFSLLRQMLIRKAEPKWEDVYDPEYSEVHRVLMQKLADHHIFLKIVKHGPDQYSAFYERLSGRDQPLSAKPEWWEHPAEPPLASTPAGATEPAPVPGEGARGRYPGAHHEPNNPSCGCPGAVCTARRLTVIHDPAVSEMVSAYLDEPAAPDEGGE